MRGVGLRGVEVQEFWGLGFRQRLGAFRGFRVLRVLGEVSFQFGVACLRGIRVFLGFSLQVKLRRVSKGHGLV